MTVTRATIKIDSHSKNAVYVQRERERGKDHLRVVGEGFILLFKIV